MKGRTWLGLDATPGFLLGLAAYAGLIAGARVWLFAADPPAAL